MAIVGLGLVQFRERAVVAVLLGMYISLQLPFIVTACILGEASLHEINAINYFVMQ